MRFVKTVVQGECQGQEIVNVLYYTFDPLLPVGFDPGDLDELAMAVRTAWEQTMKQTLAGGYRLVQVSTVQINEENATTGSYTAVAPGAAGPNGASDSDSVALYAPWKFLLSPIAGPPATRVPKRSYLAVGPLNSARVASDGKYLPDGNDPTYITAVLTQGHFINGEEFYPVRVGSQGQNGQFGVGRVIGVRAPVHARFRRSRNRW